MYSSLEMTHLYFINFNILTYNIFSLSTLAMNKESDQNFSISKK